jgi:hypothetical protein
VALIGGEEAAVIQEARRREIDDRVFNYVDVAGITAHRPGRCEQFGASGGNLCT